MKNSEYMRALRTINDYLKKKSNLTEIITHQKALENLKDYEHELKLKQKNSLSRRHISKKSRKYKQTKQNFLTKKQTPAKSSLFHEVSHQKSVKKRNKNKRNKSQNVSDRELTPNNFNYYQKIGKVMSQSNKRGSIIKSKKQSGAFLDDLSTEITRLKNKASTLTKSVEYPRKYPSKTLEKQIKYGNKTQAELSPYRYISSSINSYYY